MPVTLLQALETWRIHQAPGALVARQPGARVEASRAAATASLAWIKPLVTAVASIRTGHEHQGAAGLFRHTAG